MVTLSDWSTLGRASRHPRNASICPLISSPRAESVPMGHEKFTTDCYCDRKFSARSLDESGSGGMKILRISPSVGIKTITRGLFNIQGDSRNTIRSYLSTVEKKMVEEEIEPFNDT